MDQTARLSLVLLINLVMIIGLVIVGLSSNSLGVIAAGGDYIADSAAIGLGLLAIKVSKHPHGHPRAKSVVALINSAFLLIVTVFVVFEASYRLLNHTPDVHGLSVLIVSSIATVAMVAGVLILVSAKDEDLHMRSVMLDTVADAASSAAVAITGGIIFLAKGLYWLDSAVALLISVVIGYHALKLLRDVLHELSKKHQE